MTQSQKLLEAWQPKHLSLAQKSGRLRNSGPGSLAISVCHFINCDPESYTEEFGGNNPSLKTDHISQSVLTDK